NAWNNDAGSTVHYVYAGTTTASGGLNQSDGVNTVLFNDPDNDIAGAFDCFNGGVLAYSSYRTRGTRSFNGGTYAVIVEVDTVVQDGASCVLANHGNRDAAELLTHELGHTLGLGHSCGDSGLVACVLGSLLDLATMRPYIHADGRGAVLGDDDRAGIDFLYPSGVAAPATPAGSSGSGAAAASNSGGGSMSGFTLYVLAIGALLGLLRKKKQMEPHRTA
ncbi:MAG TPA: hypothetical protein VHE37_13155, partial [Nevskiaceae bacterium]|nr:hypothetical protein [Nevskiaceae bacterium]